MLAQHWKMDIYKKALTKTSRFSITVAVASALFFAVLWVAMIALNVFQPFNYTRLILSLWVSAGIAAISLSVLNYFAWKNILLLDGASPLAKITAWASVLLAFDSFLVEPFLLGYLFPRLNLGGTLRWQFELIIAGLLAAVTAIFKRNWKWTMFSIITVVFGLFWLIGILAPE